MQIDGKGIKGKMTNYSNKHQSFLNLVSLFMNRTGIVLAVKQMDNKLESEINVVRELVKELGQKNIVLSMDAIHCQKKTAEEIICSENDYLIKIKRNQKKLFEETEQINLNKKHKDRYASAEINRGRKERRLIKIYAPSQNIIDNWPGVKAIVYVKRKRETKKLKSTTHSYYISSLNESAEKFAEGIRYHWGIENRLHYVKDVTFKEDASKVNTGNAPGILSLFRNLVINIARINGENRIKKFTRQCAGNIEFMRTLLE
jgi:predicted transposase YbfD/YdcC